MTRRIREALSLFRADAAIVDLEPAHVLRPDLTEAIARVRRAREAQAALGEAVDALTASGLSRRDTATLLGISHQRVQQLLDRR